MASLKAIGIGYQETSVWPTAEFWKKYDAGEFNQRDAKQAFEQWIKDTQKLPAAKQVEAVVAKLKELNAGFDGKVTPRIANGIVTDFEMTAVENVSPLRAFQKLEKLNCSGGPLADLSPLRGLPIKRLYIYSTHVADLSPLKGMTLEAFHCYYTLVSDLSPLRGMPLTNLDVGDTKVTDLSALKGMQLTLFFSCANLQVADLSVLAGMPLTYLNCKGTKVPDLSVLKGMPLKQLLCDFKPERDAEILRSIKTLEKINGKPAAEFWKQFPDKKP
jgi:hypothetical protein